MCIKVSLGYLAKRVEIVGKSSLVSADFQNKFSEESWAWVVAVPRNTFQAKQDRLPRTNQLNGIVR